MATPLGEHRFAYQPLTVLSRFKVTVVRSTCATHWAFYIPYITYLHKSSECDPRVSTDVRMPVRPALYLYEEGMRKATFAGEAAKAATPPCRITSGRGGW